MKDLQFDISTREIVLSNGDAVINEESSMQHGGIILESSSAFLSNPILGIGFSSVIVIGGDLSNVNYQLNRWKQQCKSDGAKVITFTASISDAGINTNNLAIVY